jgi:hypothetical protein
MARDKRPPAAQEGLPRAALDCKQRSLRRTEPAANNEHRVGLVSTHSCKASPVARVHHTRPPDRVGLGIRSSELARGVRRPTGPESKHDVLCTMLCGCRFAALSPPPIYRLRSQHGLHCQFIGLAVGHNVCDAASHKFVRQVAGQLFAKVVKQFSGWEAKIARVDVGHAVQDGRGQINVAQLVQASFAPGKIRKRLPAEGVGVRPGWRAQEFDAQRRKPLVPLVEPLAVSSAS